MTVIADVHTDASKFRLEHRVAQVAGGEIKLLPESRMAMRNVVFAILTQVSPVRIDDRSRIEINPRHLFLVNWDHDRHAMFRGDLSHEFGCRSAGDSLGEVIPA